jgi:predicted AAA+ superfamily ATPase
MLRGFYPRIYDLNPDPSQMQADYIQTYLERDFRQISDIRDLSSFQRFVRLCAGRTGRLLNKESLAAEAGVSGVTVGHWLSVLEAGYIVYLLRPWHENLGKRLIKSPKLYFHDVCPASRLCGAESESHIASHPLRGSFFENMLVMEALKRLYPDGPSFVPVEIKSGRTVADDFLVTLRRLSQLMPAASERGSSPTA